MKDYESTLEKHLFICINERDGKQSCGGSGSQDLVDELKKWSKEQGLKETVRVNKSGCLGPCEHGIVAVCYPEGRWLTELTPKDGDKLKKLLK
jgi:predicted metal-binding protein